MRCIILTRLQWNNLLSIDEADLLFGLVSATFVDGPNALWPTQTNFWLDHPVATQSSNFDISQLSVCNYSSKLHYIIVIVGYHTQISDQSPVSHSQREWYVTRSDRLENAFIYCMLCHQFKAVRCTSWFLAWSMTFPWLYVTVVIISICHHGSWRSGLAVERWTWVRLSLGARLRSNLGQVLHTYVLLSPSSITWYWLKDGDVLWLEKWPQVCRKLIAAYRRGITLKS